jgi:flagellar hook-basal body complex protein FliE
MKEMRIQSPYPATEQASEKSQQPTKGGEKSFGQVLKNSIDEVNRP